MSQPLPEHAMPSVGAPEIIIILVLALLVFGPKRLPEMGRSLGRSVREFKKASDTARKEFGVDEIEREIKGVKKTLTDVKGDMKIDVDAEVAKPAAGQPASGDAVDEPGGDEVLVGEVVDDGASGDETATAPPESDERADAEPIDVEPIDVELMVDDWAGPSAVEDETAGDAPPDGV
jgi:TatA/E family protein of Tat protein translocase